MDPFLVQLGEEALMPPNTKPAEWPLDERDPRVGFRPCEGHVVGGSELQELGCHVARNGEKSSTRSILAPSSKARSP